MNWSKASAFLGFVWRLEHILYHIEEGFRSLIPRLIDGRHCIELERRELWVGGREDIFALY